jgi:hypothetical protein
MSILLEFPLIPGPTATGGPYFGVLNSKYLRLRFPGGGEAGDLDNHKK